MQKSLEQLHQQLEEVNHLREARGQEKLKAETEDFNATPKELIEKYGNLYYEYLEDLKLVIQNRVMTAGNEEEVFEVVAELFGPEKSLLIKEEVEHKLSTLKKELSVFKKMVFSSIITMFFLGVGLIGGETFFRVKDKERVSRGIKINPILAAQSSDGMIFKADRGDDEYGSLEQVLVVPGSVKAENEKKKAALQDQLKRKETTEKEFEEQLWEIENDKQQGFVDSYSNGIITFEQLAIQVWSAAEKGMSTTINLGDSSTSGWESNIVTENALTIARAVYLKLKVLDPSLSADSFDEMVSQKYPGRQDLDNALVEELEQLKQNPLFQTVWNENWQTIKELAKSPLTTYDTYSSKMAQIDQNHHYLNLGVPGYSSVHGVAFTRRIIDQLESAKVLTNIDSATIYFGNNDSVNNGNVEDEYYIGDETDRPLLLHTAAKLKEASTGISSFTRVSPARYEHNLQIMIDTLKAAGIRNITLIIPVVPLNWTPGERAGVEAPENISGRYQKDKSKAAEMLEQARNKYAEVYQAVFTSGDGIKPDYEAARDLAKEAIELDVMVPRIKKAYIERMTKVAMEKKTSFINLEPVLPIIDGGGRAHSPKDKDVISNDYCHPGEHVNILLALAEAVAKSSVSEDIINRTKEQLVALLIEPEIADYEIKKVIDSCVVVSGAPVEAYERLAKAKRTRYTWADISK
jgi:hypothetical protein